MTPMLTGFLLGLVSATANATSNLLGGVAARRAGVLMAPMSVLVISLVLMSLFAVGTGLTFAVEPGELPLLIGLGAVIAVGFLLFYMALQIGPVSVVSSITATSGAVAVLFAVVMLGEHPTPLQWLAVPVSTVGGFFATRSGRLHEPGVSLLGRGPALAALTVLTGGCSNALIRVPIVELGAVQAVVIQRFFTIVFMAALALAILVHRRSRRASSGDAPPAPVRHRSRRELGGTAALLLAMGAIDGVGFIGFAYGMAIAPAWLLGLVSQSGRLAAAFIATALYDEHLRPIQWIGIGLVGLGLVLAVWP